MAYSKNSKSAAVRAKLDHPVIDGDGHWLEPVPIFLDFLRDVGGPTMVDKFVKKANDVPWYGMSGAERMDRRTMRPTWWGEPANTLDRATAMVPRLFHERLDDFGIDFAVVYTSLGLFYVSNPDEELRRAVARAVNKMNAEMFAPFKGRMTPAAVVPVHTPQEAIEEATYAVRELGLKVLMIANHVRRPIEASARQVADPVAHARIYIDSLGLESPHDYDPFWARCAELKVAVTAHSGSMGWNGRESINSFTYNHIGHFANASHAFAKALLLGGVTHRFPQLRFAFLEGGVGWACNLATDLVGHWQRRRREAMESQTRPTNLDLQMLKNLFVEFGGRAYEEKWDEIVGSINMSEPFKNAEELTERAYREVFDDWGQVPVKSAEDLKRHFSERFYFGCEADDPMTAWAFDRHGNHRLRPIFSSDVGHFDVVDMTEVLEEAYELVEHGLVGPEDLREFVFENPVRLHTALNPDFFKGTVVEGAVDKLA
ncbi:MAG TPA: amidohydrolase family protein [Candidatus Limnocylindrales bacterium]|nr:amidohydrolase family protein [Candidatus Limnocylindrales bacterium]